MKCNDELFSLMRRKVPTMKLTIGLFALAAMLGTIRTVAQESNYLDLTDSLPRESGSAYLW